MPTFNSSIAASADDGRWNEAQTQFGSSASVVIIGNNPTYGSIHGWFRFTNVTIPQYSTINSASITATSDSNTTGGTVKLRIYGNDVANATNPTNAADAAAKTLTTAYIAAEPAWTDGDSFPSPDISTVIQEIVNRSDWASGNALMLLIRDDGTSTDDAWIASFDHSTLAELSITIDYTEPINTSEYNAAIAATADDGRWATDESNFSSSSSQIIVGLNPTFGAMHGFFRFLAFPADQGATIVSAVMTLIADNTEASGVTLRIYGNGADDAAAPTTAAGGNALTLTTAFVNWSPAFTDSQPLTTPDLSTIIQEIVDRPGWSANNDIMLLIKDNGSSNDGWIADHSNATLAEASIAIEYEDAGGDPPNPGEERALAGSITQVFTPTATGSAGS